MKLGNDYVKQSTAICCRAIAKLCSTPQHYQLPSIFLYRACQTFVSELPDRQTNTWAFEIIWCFSYLLNSPQTNKGNRQSAGKSITPTTQQSNIQTHQTHTHPHTQCTHSLRCCAEFVVRFVQLLACCDSYL